MTNCDCVICCRDTVPDELLPAWTPIAWLSDDEFIRPWTGDELLFI